MSYEEKLSYELVSSKLEHDQETDKFWWKETVGKAIKKGSGAGSFKALRSNQHDKPNVYRYIRINGHSIVASRIAWLLYYGEWPKGRLQFIDGDTTNTRVVNLKMSNVVPEDFLPGESPATRARKAYPREWKDKALLIQFGITLNDYIDLAVKQGNKCAICGQPETQKREGALKALAVDHCHTSNRVRGLLCSECNIGIGKFKDDVTILQRAIEYLNEGSLDDSSPVE